MQWSEEVKRIAKKYPWWKLLWWKITNKQKYKKALNAILYGEDNFES